MRTCLSVVEGGALHQIAVSADYLRAKTRRIKHASLVVGAASLFVGVLLAEFIASLQGAGGDRPIHHSGLLDVQLWVGIFGMTAVTVLIGAVAGRRPRLAAGSLFVAVLTWTVWAALWHVTSGGQVL